MTASDEITALDAGSRLLVKSWHRDGTTGDLVEVPYDRGAKLFRVQEHVVTDVFSLGAALDKIGRETSCCVIRGRPLPHIDREQALRRKTHFENVPRFWSLHDFDSIACPEGLDWKGDSEAAAAYLRGLLPAEFHGVSCYWQFTSGQGLKDGLRMRLAFWHSRPVSGDELKTWLTEKIPAPGTPRSQWARVAPVDPAIYGSVQPIYVATPIFAPDVADPVPQRSGVLIGRTHIVDTPALIAPRFSSSPAVAGKAAPGSTGHAGHGYEFHRDRIGDDADGFHEPMLSAVGAFFARNGSTADATAITEDLAAHARAAVQHGTHRAADVEQRIAGLPALVAWTREQQARTEAIQSAPGALCAAPPAAPRVPLAEAEAELSGAVADAFNAIRARATVITEGREVSPAPAIGIAAGLGIGKTEAAVLETVKFVREDPGRRVAFAIPTHATGGEIVDRLNAAAGQPIAKAWRGVSREDVSAGSGTETTMCRVAAVVGAWQSAGGSVRDVCGGAKRGWCPHNPDKPGQTAANACAYRQQFDPSVSVWVVPHAMLTSKPPKSFGRPFDMLVLDEAPWPSFYGGFNVNRPVTIAVDRVCRPHPIGSTDSAATILYGAAVADLRNALAETGGAFQRSAFERAGLTAHRARQMAAFSWKLRPPSLPIPAPMSGDAGAADRLRQRLAGQPPFHLIRRFWGLLADFLAGGETVAPDTLELASSPAGERIIVMRWREDIHSDWRVNGVLYLDGTIIEPVARQWLPSLDVKASVRAAETSVHRVQIIDAQLGKTSFASADDDEERRRQARRLQAVRNLVEVLAWRLGSAGVISYKDAVRMMRLTEIDSVRASNFGAMRGVDAWKGVGAIVIAGRPLPGPRDVERMASVASGRRVPPLGGWYPAVEGTLAMRDGTGRRVRTVQHPDPLADAFCRQVLTEIVQAEGRARGVRREDCNGLLSILLTAEPTELPIDEAVTLADVFDGVSLVASLAARGVLPGTVPDAARVLADKFDGDDPAAALRQRLSRAGEPDILKRIVNDGPNPRESVTGPYMKNGASIAGVLGEPPASAFAGFRTYRFRRTGNRKSGSVLVDASRPRSPRALFEQLCGSVDVFERVDDAPWLSATHDEANRSLPSAWLRPVSSIAQAVLGTDHRQWPPSVPVLPIGHEMFRTRWRGDPVDMHLFGDANGRPLTLLRKRGAAWPIEPRREAFLAPELPAVAPTTAATFTADDVRAVAGVPRRKLRTWMISPKARKRIREVGEERAIVEVLSVRIGHARMQEVVQSLVAARNDRS